MSDIHAPIKKHYIRANQGPFMNKTIQKAVMTCSRLHNKFLKNKTQSKKLLYQSFLKGKKSFFENLDTKNITDDKIFWKTVKPFLANKSLSNHIQ